MDFFEQRDAKYAELGAKCREGLFFHAARHVLEDAMPTSPQAKNIAASMLRSGLHLCEVREPDSYHDFLNWVGRRIFEEQYELPWKNEVWHWKDSDLLEGSPYLEGKRRSDATFRIAL